MGKTKFELITLFEVFEHLENPLQEISNLLQLSDSILFTTELSPAASPKSCEDWWYFTPETGQHIALFSHKSLIKIANKFNLNLYSNGKTLHLLTKKKLALNTVKIVDTFFVYYNTFFGRHFENKNSLLMKDFHSCKLNLKYSNS